MSARERLNEWSAIIAADKAEKAAHPEREDLMATIRNEFAWDIGTEKALRVLAEAILAAGYRKPRTITTADEVAAMPVDSIVRTHGGVPLELWEGEDVEREWRVTGHRPWTDAELAKNLPATVLWEPSA